VDVVVIGGGIGGVSISYELAERARVVLVEKEPQLAHHTTGRSAAQYLQTYGNATVRALTTASRGDFDRLEAAFDTGALLTPRDLLWIADAEFDHRVDDLLAEGGPSEILTPARAVAACPVLRPELLTRVVADRSGSDMDVAAIHQAYVRGLVERGGEILRSAPVTAVEPGVGVTAGDRKLPADVVVDAAGAWADEIARLAGVAGVGLVPKRRTLFTASVDPSLGIDDRELAAWPMVSDIGDRFYFKPDGPRLLVSPADETPSAPCDARPDELDVAVALERVNTYTTLGLRHVASAWAGLRTFAPDYSPVVGARAGHPGFVFFAGQGGYGIQMAPALARTGAALVLDGELPADVAAAGVTTADLSPDRFP
jgi:D-arginine dehydrogenase